MPSGLAKYACDECRSRKIKCSREGCGCEQCKADSRSCVYSRSGVIRRKARQYKSNHSARTSSTQHGATPSSEPRAPSLADLRTQMDEDIDQIQGSLDHYGEGVFEATGILANLEKEYSSFWIGPSLKDMALELGVLEKRILPFPDHQEHLFTKVAPGVINKGRPVFQPVPSQLLHDIQYRPDTVQHKAYMVIVYGILLTDACLDSSYDQLTIVKLRWNLRIALDDANLLLEPSDINIQAMTLLACHVQEVSSPSLCWTLISNACRMLQSLGINSRNLDAEIKERRLLLFWFLNAIDKSLALTFGRPPSFHGVMYNKLPLIPELKLLEYQPHMPTVDGTEPFQSMFGAHLLRQMHTSSIVLSDIWTCLYEDGSKFEQAKRSLDQWWQQTTSVLQACLLAEQPFIDAAARTSMELGLKSLEFHYNYLKVLLIRSRPALRDECVSTSRQALTLLDYLVSDSNDVYNGIIWHLLYCPFTPFFVLFGDILSIGESRASRQSLEAMEKMSSFLSQMKSRHPRAEKLHAIAATLVLYAKESLSKARNDRPQFRKKPSDNGMSTVRTNRQEETTPMTDTVDSRPQAPDTKSVDSWSEAPLQNLFDDPLVQALDMDWNSWLPNLQDGDINGLQWKDSESFSGPDGLAADPYGFFTDSSFDWLSWSPSIGDGLTQAL